MSVELKRAGFRNMRVTFGFGLCLAACTSQFGMSYCFLAAFGKIFYPAVPLVSRVFALDTWMASAPLFLALEDREEDRDNVKTLLRAAPERKLERLC